MDISKMGKGVLVQLESRLPYSKHEDVKKRLLEITEEEWNDLVRAWYKLEDSFRAYVQNKKTI